MLLKAVLWSSATRLCFSTKALIYAYSVCHTINPYHIVDHLPIYNPLSANASKKSEVRELIPLHYAEIYLAAINNAVMEYNVWHTIHLRVRSGSERNRRHLQMGERSSHARPSIAVFIVDFNRRMSYSEWVKTRSFRITCVYDNQVLSNSTYASFQFRICLGKIPINFIKDKFTYS